MKDNFELVYQLKVTLKYIEPSIWRRIQVPETYTFWDLHVAIQNAMGWSDSHLHDFEIISPFTDRTVTIGIPDEEDSDALHRILPGWECPIENFFHMGNKVARYYYDFGDDWMHTVELEEMLPRKANTNYPICIAGERACPPEDCGGVIGYSDLLEIIVDKSHKRYKEMIEWLGGWFDPEHFNPEEVKFDNPEGRLRELLKK